MAFPLLVLAGAVGAAYLYKYPEARQKAMTFGQDMMDTSLAKLPPKYQDMASKAGLRRRSSTTMLLTDGSTKDDVTVINQPYTSSPQTNYPPPRSGDIPGSGEI